MEKNHSCQHSSISFKKNTQYLQCSRLAIITYGSCAVCLPSGRLWGPKGLCLRWSWHRIALQNGNLTPNTSQSGECGLATHKWLPKDNPSMCDLRKGRDCARGGVVHRIYRIQNLQNTLSGWLTHAFPSLHFGYTVIFFFSCSQEQYLHSFPWIYNKTVPTCTHSLLIYFWKNPDRLQDSFQVNNSEVYIRIEVRKQNAQALKSCRVGSHPSSRIPVLSMRNLLSLCLNVVVCQMSNNNMTCFAVRPQAVRMMGKCSLRTQ